MNNKREIMANPTTTKNILNIVQKFYIITLSLLLIVLPYNAFFQVIIQYKLNIPVLTYYKEVLLCIMFVLNLFFLQKKKLIASKNLILISGLYFFWFILATFWTTDISIQKLILGFKYDGVILMAIFLIGLTAPSFITVRSSQFLKLSFYSLLSAILLGLILHVFLKPENFVIFGYRPDWSTYFTGQSLAYCQKLEGVNFCRFQGLFSGPNQAGANALLAIVLFFSLQFQTIFKKIINFIVPFSSLILTMSRSAYLALLAFITIKRFNKFTKKLLFVLAPILVILIFYFNREGSNSDRLNLYYNALISIYDNWIIGKGVGFSGPASHSFTPFLTENTFLQLWVNYGIVGLTIFVSWYYMLIRLMFKQKYKLFGLFLICLIIPLNLLHYFEDSSFTYTLFLLLGICANKSSAEK